MRQVQTVEFGLTGNIVMVLKKAGREYSKRAGMLICCEGVVP